MQVQHDTVVAIHYTLKDESGAVVDSSYGGLPLVYLHGRGQLLPGLERALNGACSGDRVSLNLSPADAFGERDEAWVQVLPHSFFSGVNDTLAPGMQFDADTPNGQRRVTIQAISAEGISVDGNHPLAGVSLHVDAEVRHVRPATAEELQDGQVDP